MNSKSFLPLTVIVTGVAIFFGSLWFGCYGIDRTSNTWAEFPCFISTIVGCLAGVVIVVAGIVHFSDLEGGAS